MVTFMQFQQSLSHRASEVCLLDKERLSTILFQKTQGCQNHMMRLETYFYQVMPTDCVCRGIHLGHGDFPCLRKGAITPYQKISFDPCSIAKKLLHGFLLICPLAIGIPHCLLTQCLYDMAPIVTLAFFSSVICQAS